MRRVASITITRKSGRAAASFRPNSAPLRPPPITATLCTDGRAVKSRCLVELEAGEPGVEPALADQRAMRAAFDDAAIAHHDDPRGGTHGGEAVGDDEGSAFLHQPFERLLY